MDFVLVINDWLPPLSIDCVNRDKVCSDTREPVIGEFFGHTRLRS